MNNGMTSKDNTTILCKEEAEERNAPEAKMVEATDFQSVGTGSIPVRSTRVSMKHWFDKHGKDIIAKDVIVAGNKGFNCVTETDTIDGRAFSRLSVLQR